MPSPFPAMMKFFCRSFWYRTRFVFPFAPVWVEISFPVDTIGDFIRRKRAETGMAPLKLCRGGEYAGLDLRPNRKLNGGHGWKDPNPDY